MNQILEAGNDRYPLGMNTLPGLGGSSARSEGQHRTWSPLDPSPLLVYSLCFRQSLRLGSREIISKGIWEIRTVSRVALPAFEDLRSEIKTINNFSLVPEAGRGEWAGLGRALAYVALALVVYGHWRQSSRSLEFSYPSFKSSFWAIVDFCEWRFWNYKRPLSVKFLNKLLILKAESLCTGLSIILLAVSCICWSIFGCSDTECPEEDLCTASLCPVPVSELCLLVCLCVCVWVTFSSGR